MEILFNNIKNQIVKELKEANSNIKIAMAWFTHEDIFDTMCRKLNEGIKVELIIIDDYINNGKWGLDFQKFIELGGRLYYGEKENPMHNKFCLIDNQTLINGSYNWTYYAEHKNWENVIIHKNNFSLTNLFKSEFKKIKNTLRLSTDAIKYDVSKIDESSLFSNRNYLAHDLANKGRTLSNKGYYESAFRISQGDVSIKQTYKKEFEALKIIKRTTESLGVKATVAGQPNKFFKLIPVGSQIPIRHTHVFKTTVDDQTKIEVEMYRGLQEDISGNKKIGSLRLLNKLCQQNFSYYVWKSKRRSYV